MPPPTRCGSNFHASKSTSPQVGDPFDFLQKKSVMVSFCIVRLSRRDAGYSASCRVNLNAAMRGLTPFLLNGFIIEPGPLFCLYAWGKRKDLTPSATRLALGWIDHRCPDAGCERVAHGQAALKHLSVL